MRAARGEGSDRVGAGLLPLEALLHGGRARHTAHCPHAQPVPRAFLC